MATIFIKPKYLIIMVLTLCSGYYFACQCNKPIVEIDNPQSGDSPAPSDGGNPQAGDTPDTTEEAKHTGIPNAGNTCYMNSTLQTLFAFYGDLIKAQATGAAEDTMAANMLKLFNKVTKVDKNAITDNEIRDFYDSMKAEKVPTHTPGKSDEVWSKNFGTQQDANELLGKIFDWLKVSKIDYKSFLKRKVSPCEKRDLTTECISQLGLNITGITTMQAALDNFFSDEPLEFSWIEGSPKEEVTKSKRLGKLNNLTNNTLVISLKRFNVDLTKNNSIINNVLEVTVRKEQADDLTADKTYKLVGFIHHGGDCGGGHYEAYIKEGSKWICYDDAFVSEKSEAEAEKAAKKAYVFFYQPK